MAKSKPKPSLAAALSFVTPESTTAPAIIPTNEQPAPRSSGRPRRTEQTKLVGAQLGLSYSKSLNLLSAETGKSNRQLLEEALDKLFTAYGAKLIK